MKVNPDKLIIKVSSIQMEYTEPPGFSCPGAPFLPALSIFFNSFLFGQLHWEAWVRFVVLGIGAVILYALYGQYHADPDFAVLQDSVVYQRASTMDDEAHVSNA